MKIRKKFKKGKNYVTANALKMEEEATQRGNGKIETSKKRKINKNKK
jgi:hypothetical protein